MLTPILATDDPYETLEEFRRAGWTVVFQTPTESGDPLTCVSLCGAPVMLGVSGPPFLSDEARPHRGAGVEFHVLVPDDRIDAIHAAHVAAGHATGDLRLRPWGERAFHSTIAGYRFLVASEPGGGAG